MFDSLYICNNNNKNTQLYDSRSTCITVNITLTTDRTINSTVKKRNKLQTTRYGLPLNETNEENNEKKEKKEEEKPNRQQQQQQQQETIIVEKRQDFCW